MDTMISPTFLTDLPPWAQTLTGLVALALAAVVSHVIVKLVALELVDRGLDTASTAADSDQIDPIVRRLAYIVPALAISLGVEFVPNLPADLVKVVRNLASAFIVVAALRAISTALDLLNTIYQRRPHAANRPIKGYLQVVKILVFAAGVILIVAVLMEQSPLLLLSGLGAMAAVLMLVFKDTILSLVASVQLSSNDMLRVGDWIEMPQQNADGDVIDIALHTVKVQNFDKTITTIPTYRLITESFRNWRGMADAGGRRIKRAIHLDQNSVRFLSHEELAKLASLTLLQPYLDAKRREIGRWNGELTERGEDSINHRALTNAGTFRAYVRAYIEAHPRIRADLALLVRQLAPDAEGLPIEIYCFTDTVAWPDYEAIQADIFDHLLAVLPRFELRLFQRPAGVDMREFAATASLTNDERRQSCQMAWR